MLAKEDLEKTLDRIQGWINTADQKVGILLTLETALFTFLFLNIYRIAISELFYFNIIEVFSLTAAIVFGTYSFLKLLIAIVPHLNKSKHPHSFTYYGDIASLKAKDFEILISKKENEDYLEDISNQVYINARICFRKHMAFKVSLISFSLFIFSIILFIFSRAVYGH